MIPFKNKIEVREFRLAIASGPFCYKLDSAWLGQTLKLECVPNPPNSKPWIGRAYRAKYLAKQRKKF